MAKIPTQLYVVAVKYKPRPGEKPENPFGFLHAYEPGKAAFEKKKATQWDWAYNRYSGLVYGSRLEERGTELWIIGEKYEYDPYNRQAPSRKVRVEQPVDFQPVVWNNTPQTGFEITKSVSRYSTSNKLWRVLDPRGVEFEITTGVFEELINNVTIVKGVIQEPCVWVSNKTLVAA